MLSPGIKNIFLTSSLRTLRYFATQPESMNVFDRRAKLLQRERALERSGNNPRTYEYLREEVIIYCIGIYLRNNKIIFFISIIYSVFFPLLDSSILFSINN